MSSFSDIPPAPRMRPDTGSLVAPLPVELFDPSGDPERHRGRERVREAVLAMTPIDGREPLLPGPQRTPGGPFWGVRADNGLTLAIRVGSFATGLVARRDAVEVLARAGRFEIVPVQAVDSKLMSFWVLLSDRVVLVAGQAWRREALSMQRQFIRVLDRLPRGTVPHPPHPQRRFTRVPPTP